MAVDLKKWKQRNAAERVKAALARPKKDNTGERLRNRFAAGADNAIKALNNKARNPWLKYGYNGDVVVTTRLGAKTVPVTGDEAIALSPRDAQAFLKDVIEATKAGQLDRQLLAAAGAAPVQKERELKLTTVATAAPHRPATAAVVGGAPASVARAPMDVGLKAER